MGAKAIILKDIHTIVGLLIVDESDAEDMVRKLIENGVDEDMIDVIGPDTAENLIEAWGNNSGVD